ncbi:arabinose transporter permease [Marispirochaeta aestuarii]|uniref:Arabinose transporter permease n=1 Tax=Marispirochaeta aestuarii TaxID=1963862 RepID=A0A1Y1RWT6_9SPIO|nr:sugar ABC transporter permease [Marispirochaeta aestuarii]ORC34099.1 arabinose transporter permease [Marispirochaeta aestuarii]
MKSRSVSKLTGIFYSARLAPYVFVLPFLLVFFVFFLYPTISSIIMSLHDVKGFGNWEFIGLKNYERLNNIHFFNALRTSSLYTFLTIVILIPVPMIIAIFLNSKLMLARNFFRSVVFMPALISVVVAGIAFRLLFGNTEVALINSILARFGIEPVRWMLNKSTGMFLMVVLGTWRYAGVNMIYFMSGLQAIPVELYESASIDGAGVFRKFFGITLPLLKPIAIYVLTISIYGGYAMFTESYVFWNQSMPGDIGMTIVRYMYQEGLLQNRLGVGSAVGVTLLAIVFVINIIQLRLFGMFRKE